ncbi:hypothetical protein [Mycoplasma sp. Ms02]|uniref:hypothetical protein n=1 Tax=Mycoplasma sp. Ms02 TaxID=353851 RepID=UPI001C8AF83E|nr:hypothetical protein [Mycoplasma sp. Ms02]QZE12658.1 hypothetical protein K4L35_01580 [Mycoplasma sp. Ms02]
MNQIIKALKNKIEKDQKRLKWYAFTDKMLGLSILVLNLTIISLAITALFKLIEIIKKTKDYVWYEDVSFLLLVILVVFIIASFVLTIVIEVYKVNARYREYEKVKNTIEDLAIKYHSEIITIEELNEYLEQLWVSVNKKKKLVIAKVVAGKLQQKGN